MICERRFGRSVLSSLGLFLSKEEEKMISGKTLAWASGIGLVLLAIAIAITKMFGLKSVALGLGAFSLFIGLVLIDLVRAWAKRRGMTNPTTLRSTYVALIAGVLGVGGIEGINISPGGVLALGVIAWKELRYEIREIRQDVKEINRRIDDILKRLP
jgi:uncharacterized membrane protein